MRFPSPRGLRTSISHGFDAPMTAPDFRSFPGLGSLVKFNQKIAVACYLHGIYMVFIWYLHGIYVVFTPCNLDVTRFSTPFFATSKSVVQRSEPRARSLRGLGSRSLRDLRGSAPDGDAGVPPVKTSIFDCDFHGFSMILKHFWIITLIFGNPLSG